MKDITLQSRLKSLGIEPIEKTPAHEKSGKIKGPGFNHVLKKAIEEVSEAVQDLIAGGETNLHEAMIALQKADVSFKVLMEVRDKIISAYKEIMRMQV